MDPAANVVVIDILRFSDPPLRSESRRIHGLSQPNISRGIITPGHGVFVFKIKGSFRTERPRVVENKLVFIFQFYFMPLARLVFIFSHIRVVLGSDIHGAKLRDPESIMIPEPLRIQGKIFLSLHSERNLHGSFPPGSH
ncbi:MAG: hypothetical protein BWY44_01266 [Candidatus Omnitrophica bacterium ADurb.Bin292]|nr:MAG: hypothetical protein BWY44_01266 [Candidatus Omnitrophica bacterium ADurb.Bin292]